MNRFPGWTESSRGATSLDQTCRPMRSYLQAMEELCGAPVHIVSTGPDRSRKHHHQVPLRPLILIVGAGHARDYQRLW